MTTEVFASILMLALLFGCAPKRVKVAPPVQPGWTLSTDKEYAYTQDANGNLYLLTKHAGAVSKAAADHGVVGPVDNLGQLYFVEKTNP